MEIGVLGLQSKKGRTGERFGVDASCKMLVDLFHDM